MDEAHRTDRVADAARERIAEALKVALEPVEDAPIDDATRRLMLHLSIEPPQASASAAPLPAAAGRDQVAASASLLRRIFRQRERKQADDGSKSGSDAA